MIKTIFKKWNISAGAILMGGIAIFVALIIFNVTTRSTMKRQMQTTMQEANAAAITSISYSVHSFAEMLEQHAKTIGTLPKLSKEYIFAALDAFAEDERFERVTLVTNEGIAYSSHFGEVKVPDMSILANMETEHATVAVPRVLNNELLVDISAPFHHGGKRAGRLVACVGNSEFEKMFITNALQGDAGITMFTAGGTVITNISQFDMPVAVADSLYDMLGGNGVTFTLGSLTEMQYNIANNLSGWIQYTIGGKSFSVNYQPVGINDWWTAIIATDYTLHLQVGNIMDHAIILTTFIVVVVVLISVAVLMQRVKDQNRIDSLKSAYCIAIRNTNETFYEADLDDDTIVDLSNGGDGTPAKYSEVTRQMEERCAPDTRQSFSNTLSKANISEKIKEGVAFISLEYHTLSQNDELRWKLATIVPMQDNKSHANKLIYMENDITDEKRRNEKLKLSASLDGLSKLYNKLSTQKYIANYLSGEGRIGQHALMILDIDNFKSVNDNLGHLMGDTLIAEYSAAMKALFRADDILGRIGGDEFMILIKNYNDIALVREKAMAVCRAFCHEYKAANTDVGEAVNTSASIGIALFDKDGDNFEELYKAADIALYVTKTNGKNKFAFYDKSMQTNK